MRIVIDYERCQGNAQCVLLLPDVFEIGDDLVMKVLEEDQPESRRAQLEQVARICPTMAISLEVTE